MKKVSTEQYSKQVGSNIRARRKEYPMTQEELAEAVDISRTYLSMIERGHRKAQGPVLIKIAETLGTTVNVLCFGLQQYDHEDYVAEVEDILYDCTPVERAIILENARSLKLSPRTRRGIL